MHIEPGSMTRRYLIGIDDTDNQFSRGTGFRARHMASLIDSGNLGKVIGITRHQLFVHPDIPYTSHNSSACLEVETDKPEELRSFCKAYLRCECADGSDVGLCIAPADSIASEIIEWGMRAKKEVLKKQEAYDISGKYGIYLEGFLGTRDGVIGSLAAVGLRKSGNDGRFIWLKGQELREFSGIYSVEELTGLSLFDEIKAKDNVLLKPGEKVFVAEWIRPVLVDSKIIIIVEPVFNNNQYEWTIASKEYIKSISN